MNEKEIAELRRRFKPERSNIQRVRGCYINGSGEVISTFDQPLGETLPVMSEQVLSLLRRTLSGSLGRNLHAIPFTTRQVSEGEEHRLLQALRQSALQDEAAVGQFFDRVRQSVKMEGNYLILLASDRYDVPTYSKNEEEGDSTQVFSYILCSICPVRTDRKPTLGVEVEEKRLLSMQEEPCVANPELGFVFPAFDDRAANLYSAWMYTRSASECYPDFTASVFGAAAPMPATTQRENFSAALSDAVGEDCDYATISYVRGAVARLIEAHKAERVREPLFVTADNVKDVLLEAGVPQEKAGAFVERYTDSFGAGCELRPANIVETRRLSLATPDVAIKVAPERGDLIETRTIDGVKYILVRAEGDVEVNGVRIHIAD